MQIYYINLDTDHARRVSLEAQLQGMGLVAERVSALRPADIDPQLITTNTDSARTRHVTAGELACTLSHQLAWRRMLDAGLPYALFLEDDALLSKRLKVFLAACEPMPPHIDVLRVETNLPRMRLGPVEGRIGDLTDIRSIHSLDYGAAGYILTRNAARKLLAELCPLDVPVDITLYSPRSRAFTTLTIRQVVPAPVANGPARDVIAGNVVASNLAAARRARGEEIIRRYQTSAHYRRWGTGWGRTIEQGYLRIRNGLRNAAGSVFKGIRTFDIPLL